MVVSPAETARTRPRWVGSASTNAIEGSSLHQVADDASCCCSWARVNVTGTVEAPEIVLSSTPERPEDEILSALLFGRSATQLSALEAAQLAGALATLSGGGGGGFNLVGGLRDALGFSSLDIGVGEGGTASFSGGRYLARDVYLELFSGTESSATGAVISWEVRPNIVLRTKLASDNEQAFAVLYERDF